MNANWDYSPGYRVCVCVFCYAVGICQTDHSIDAYNYEDTFFIFL